MAQWKVLTVIAALRLWVGVLLPIQKRIKAIAQPRGYKPDCPDPSHKVHHSKVIRVNAI